MNLLNKGQKNKVHKDKMKYIKNIFAKFIMLAVVLGCVVMPAVADNGCENENNDMISAEFALCSTHAYNIGETKNPNASDRELMHNVIAMKTEVVTQQMYRHYEQMESMLKRFRTQLEKAVLTANLQAAGAASEKDSDDSSSYTQTNMNSYMAGVKDCSAISLDKMEQTTCYNQNLTTISNSWSSSTKPTNAMQKQLAGDYKLVCGSFSDTTDSPKPADCVDNKDKDKDDSNKSFKQCTDPKSLNTKTKFQECLNKHRQNISKLYNEAQKEKAQYSTPAYGMTWGAK
jgi:hypothetical protein